ncbi:MAG TPA: transglycosylase domain-containing protein, partial [Marmoricola sp.]|nr:transglycosylase domain-containing protein [Marmoricola sp.]
MAQTPRKQLTSGAVLQHLAVIVAVSGVMGVLVAGMVIPFAGVLGVGGAALQKSMKDLPEELRTQPLPQRTRVLDRNGNLVATFYDQNRVTVKLSQVAPVMRNAIVAIEDSRFYDHGAIDLKGTLRAFVTNQANNGVTQGGSTITQQLAKQTLLNQAHTKEERLAATEDTYERKIKELRHAIAFEKNYSKQWILERYLNIAYFGDGAHGIQSAARHYFSVDAKDLTLKQAALLAGLVRNPYGYDPTRFPDEATQRRDTVLMRMAQLGMVPDAFAERVSKQPLGLKVTPMRNGCMGSSAPFFCDYVRRYLLADPALGRTVDDRKQLLNSGGLTIKTTVDMRYERAAIEAAHNRVAPTDNAIGALAMVQPGTGEVLAIAQSRPMGRKAKKGQTFLNYIVDSKYGDANGFQAGSTFKVFVLASALEQGMPTSTRFYSPQQISIPQNEFQTCDGAYPVYAPWSPENSTGAGTFDMYTGTQHSVNTYFAQLEKVTGLCKPYSLARSMGVDLTDPQHERVPSFVLGIADVSPLEMAGAYATFAARGLHCDTRPVTRILNSEGELFKAYPKKCQQVMEQNTADTVNDILRGVMEPGGFGQALALDKPSAGKTGTINGNMAVWFCGYTPSVATAAMVAGANQQGHWVTLNGQTLNGDYVNSAFGSTVAGPMWAAAMHAVQDTMPNLDFVRPTRVEQDNQGGIIVPNVIGMTVTDATAVLEDAGFGV